MNALQNMPWTLWLATYGPAVIAFVSSQAAARIQREHWPAVVTGIVTVAITSVAAFALQFIRGGDYSVSVATLEALGYSVFAGVIRWMVFRDTDFEKRLFAAPRKLPKQGESSTHYAGVPDNATPAKAKG